MILFSGTALMITLLAIAASVGTAVLLRGALCAYLGVPDSSARYRDAQNRARKLAGR
jgi:hypothetical protein